MSVMFQGERFEVADGFEPVQSRGTPEQRTGHHPDDFTIETNEQHV